MILGIEIALAIVGLLALFTGKMNITGKKLVYGVPARLLGLLALTPLPAAFVVIIVYVAARAPADPERFAADNKVTIAVIEAVIVIGIAILVFGIGALLAVPRPEPVRRPGRYEIDDDQDEKADDDHDRGRGTDRRPWDR